MQMPKMVKVRRSPFTRFCGMYYPRAFIADQRLTNLMSLLLDGICFLPPLPIKGGQGRAEGRNITMFVGTEPLMKELHAIGHQNLNLHSFLEMNEADFEGVCRQLAPCLRRGEAAAWIDPEGIYTVDSSFPEIVRFFRSQIPLVNDSAFSFVTIRDCFSAFYDGEWRDTKLTELLCAHADSFGIHHVLRWNVAAKQELILFSDRWDTDAPVDLASCQTVALALAAETVRLAVPRVMAAPASCVVDARHDDKLRQHLAAYRLGMQEVSAHLRARLEDLRDKGHNVTYDLLRREARFLVESHIEPALAKLDHLLKTEKRSLYWRLFGKVAKYIYCGARFYTAGPAKAGFDAMIAAVEAGEDVASHLAAKETLERRLGLAYLLNLKRAFGYETVLRRRRAEMG